MSHRRNSRRMANMMRFMCGIMCRRMLRMEYDRCFLLC
jgi:hypothetical protein